MVLIIITGGQITPEIEIPSSATILEVKRRIEERLNVEVERQTLWLDDQILLQNEEIVGNHICQRYGMLRLGVTPLPGQPKCNILVRLGNQVLGHARVRETKTVADLRSKIVRRWGILSGRCTLFHLSTEMLDCRPLSAYYITEGSEVEVNIDVDTR